MCKRFVLAVMLMAAPVVMATAITINPSADALVVSGGGKAGNNYGAAGALALYGSSTTNGQVDSVMKFDFTTTKSLFDSTFGVGNWNVDSVTLQLTTASGMSNSVIIATNVAGPIEVDYMADANSGWPEGTGTPAAPTTNGITYTSMNSTYLNGSEPSLGSYTFNNSGSTQSYSLGLGSGLINDINSGIVGSLHLFPTSSSTVYTFNSENFTSPSSRPILTVDAVAAPEPASVGLIAIGIMSLTRRRRK